MIHRSIVLASLSCLLLTAACGKGEDGLVVSLAKTTLDKAKEHANKGNFKDARDSCKLIDDASLRKLESDQGKAMKAEVDSFCQVDVPAGEGKADIEKAYTEFQTSLTKEPTRAGFLKGRVESACESAKSSQGYFDTWKGSDRPSAKALAETMKTKCSPESLAIPTPPPPATTAAPTPAARTASKKK